MKGLNELLGADNPARNILWELTEFSEFQQMVSYYLEKARQLKKKVIYIRFSEQSQLEKTFFTGEGECLAEICDIPLTHRFEQFTIEVCRLLERGDKDYFYIFDCLSEMQTAWATDLMMENFFMVITPIVRQMKAKAFYPLIRSRHSMGAIDKIKEHAEVLLELFSDFKNLYLRIRKQEGQDTEETGPFIFNGQSGFVPVTDGVTEARFHKAMSFALHSANEHSADSWDRFFYKVREDFERGADITEDLSRICDIMMSRDPRIREMIREHFEPTDYFFVKEHMVGTGMIGGKACGMLTARKIVENKRPDLSAHMEPHNSFFIGSDVFYTYIVENGFWDLRVRQREPEEYFTLAEEFADKLMHGTFSKEMEEEFIRLLTYYGPAPVIVRSSSILEDGFGNAFAGKYESVFCAGNGTITERLKEFEDAIRVVYASTLSKSALDYRLRRGLNNKDEQMALLVMRVSGARFGKYYMPCAAGVGYSYSTYRFLDSLDPKAGMLRLVMGLGTCAVDRIEGSYPRLVSLDKPEATSFKSPGEHHRYSQRNIQLIDQEAGELIQVPFSKVEPFLPDYLKKLLLEHDMDAERRFRDRGMYRDVMFVTCKGIACNREIMRTMQEMMQSIQSEYEQPVDVEFTININPDKDYVINLLQCRPLQVFEDRGRHLIPEDLSTENVFVDCRHTSMGQSQECKIDAIVYVDPIAYYNMPYQKKYEIAKAIGRINWYYQGKEKNLLLMVPGRVGTSSPELGVPTTFSDISEFHAIFEIAESRAGYNPELSYGSHIFQDLVENEILYMAVFEDERTACFVPEKITALGNRLAMIDPESEVWENIIGLYVTEDQDCMLYHDLYEERLVCALGGKV